MLGGGLKLQQLDQAAALQTLADIACDNPALDAAPEPDRLRLITETCNAPLEVGQEPSLIRRLVEGVCCIGRGRCDVGCCT